jgi:hydrogenase expression/formation protein HypD
MQSIYMLVRQMENDEPRVEIQYRRAVRPEGNRKAQEILYEVFELYDDWWRGLGVLPASGLKPSSRYSHHDAEKNFDVDVEPTREDKGCICGEILKGIKTPKDCKLFARGCTPSEPVGSCMVSHEGACHAYYRYNR